MTRANGLERNPVRKAQVHCDTDVAKEFGLQAASTPGATSLLISVACTEGTRSRSTSSREGSGIASIRP